MNMRRNQWLTLPIAIVSLAASLSAFAPAEDTTDDTPVRRAIEQYVTAYGTLSVDAVKAVWPSVDAKALGRAFAGLESQALNFVGCRIVMADDDATAQCTGTAVFVPKIGNRTEHLEYREWTFAMKKLREQWTIARVVVQ